MIATQTQPNLTLYSWDVSEGMAVLRCRSEDGIGDVALGFTSLAELESFATATAQMAQDYRLSLSGEEPAPPMSEVDRLLVEAVVSSRPTRTTSQCPFCDTPKCVHFVGWTDDGKRLEVNHDGNFLKMEEMLPGDRVVNVGSTAKVYRPAPPDHAARNLAICNKARAGVGQPPLTPEEYAALPF